jgi:hypothetical protein
MPMPMPIKLYKCSVLQGNVEGENVQDQTTRHGTPFGIALSLNR